MLAKNILPALFLLIAVEANSQDFSKDLHDLQEKKDTTGQLNLLKQWETKNPKDPEMFIAYFNYFVQRSMKEVISLEAIKKSDESFQIKDTATGKPIGYLNSSIKYQPDILQNGFNYVDRGIALYPTRLDMRFGKIYMLGETADYTSFTKYLVETIDYGNTINNAWTWEKGKPLDDAKNFFLNSMQDYVAKIYNTENDDLLPLMRDISTAVLKYNPAHVESLSNVALTYLITGEYDKALEYLLRAEQANPKDAIVLNNIAQAYKRKKDNNNAKLYFQKIIKVGTAEEVGNAKREIAELN